MIGEPTDTGVVGAGAATTAKAQARIADLGIIG